MSAANHQQQLRAYGELAVKVALNLQPGQRLLVVGPLATGLSFEAAPLVRHIAESAYRAGATLVEALWGDESLLLTRVRSCAAIPSASFQPGCRER